MPDSFFPKVDICVVTYNQESLIEAGIQSILNQDYPNFRIIISDDCSQDNTPDILKKLTELHPDKIQLNLNPKNLGITGNSIHVLSLSDADYVAFLAGDDLMRKDRISKQVRHLQKHPEAAGCMSDVCILDVDSQKSEHVHFPDFSSNNFLKILTTYNQAPSSTMMLNRSKYPNLQYDPRTPVVSDWLLVNEVAAKGLVYIDEPLTIYRRHSANTTLRGDDRTYLDDRLVAIDILFSKIRNHYWNFRYARSNVYLGVATRYWHAGKKKESTLFIAYSFFEYPLNKNIYISFFKLVRSLRK